MSGFVVSEVANVLARVQFDRKRLNQELDAIGEMDFQALENRFRMGIVNDRELIETVLDSWVHKHGCQATVEVICRVLESNEDRLASGKSS
jgi:hypothetical protein